RAAIVAARQRTAFKLPFHRPLREVTWQYLRVVGDGDWPATACPQRGRWHGSRRPHDARHRRDAHLEFDATRFWSVADVAAEPPDQWPEDRPQSGRDGDRQRDVRRPRRRPVAAVREPGRGDD